MPKTISWVVDRNGDSSIETSGFKGSECTAATADLEKVLGAADGDRVMKPEFYEDPNQERVEIQE